MFPKCDIKTLNSGFKPSKVDNYQRKWTKRTQNYHEDAQMGFAVMSLRPHILCAGVPWRGTEWRVSWVCVLQWAAVCTLSIICLCVCFPAFIGSKNEELTILVGSGVRSGDRTGSEPGFMGTVPESVPADVEALTIIQATCCSAD